MDFAFEQNVPTMRPHGSGGAMQFGRASNSPLSRVAGPGVSSTLTITLSTGAGADPFIPGTSTPLYRVAALLIDGGMTVAQVKDDFPSLTEEQIVMARDHALSFPSTKRYPAISLKRLLRNSGFAQVDVALRRKRAKD
jgi:uncharacterized protein (DUF433 family)